MNAVIQPIKATPLFVVSFLFACFAFSSAALAVSPPPDGGYPGFNTAEGDLALLHLSPQDGGFNTAVGAFSLWANVNGSFNTAVGAGALDLNTSHNNTAIGAAALLFNTAGDANTATGAAALLQNTTGFGNTALGATALLSNTAGAGNTAVGAQALQSLTGGGGSTRVQNTAVGAQALQNLTSGDVNTALGASAGGDVITAHHVICIGAGVSGADVPETTWIGNVYSTTTVSGTTLPVIVSDGGQLGTAASARRFKKEIEPMDQASESILALKPVTFHYKSDKTNTPQFGLVAEDVAQVNPDLVVRDKNCEIYSVRYDAVNAMLLNEFLKEHRKVQELEANAASQQKQIEALTAGLQKVSAQLEVSKPAPQTVLNNQ